MWRVCSCVWLTAVLTAVLAARLVDGQTTAAERPPPADGSAAAGRPLPDDLPRLRLGQTATIAKCCGADEALVRSAAGQPACQPVDVGHRWQPRLLNGRSRQHAPPDGRTKVRADGNFTCADGHFWVERDLHLLNTGQLYLADTDALFPAGGFCADRLLSPDDDDDDADDDAGDGQAEAARVCNISMHQESSLLDVDELRSACLREVCARKCCPRGLKLRVNDQACIPQNRSAPWRPVFHTQRTQPVAVDRFTIVAGNPVCSPSSSGKYGRVYPLMPAFTDNDIFYLQLDNTLWVPQQDVTFLPHQFCVDQGQYAHQGRVVDYDFGIVCFGEPLPSVYTPYRLAGALLVVSLVFLFVTFVVYAAIPELQNVHGRCLLSHTAALFTACLCGLVGRARVVYENMAWCQVTAIVMYYSLLANCFWLNVMSFDIWRTFSQVRSAAGDNKTKRFVRYSLYGWLCPLVLTAVMVAMQFAPDRLVPPEDFLRPGLGVNRCWFQVPSVESAATGIPEGGWAILAYLYGPMLVLMLANLVFFLLTARSLFHSEEDTQMVRKRKTGMERLRIYVSLCIVMGIPWITEALSYYLGPKYLWYVTDVINGLQSVFVFVLFTLRGRARHIIARHLDGWAVFRWCRCCRTPAGGGRLARPSDPKTRTTSMPAGSSTTRDRCEEDVLTGAQPKA